MVSRLSRWMRGFRKQLILPTIQQMESRRLLSSVFLQGTSGDDHILVSFDPVTGEGTVTGASNVADGTKLPASVNNNRLSITIDVGDGNDYVKIGLEPTGQYGYYDASRTTIFGGAGDDELIGGDGPVTMDGGAGNDKLSSLGHHDEWANDLWFRGATKGIHVNLKDGKVYNDGQGGIDQVSGMGSVQGTRFDDKILAGGLTGWFYGDEGNDLLSSAMTNDRLSGMAGGVGDDTLVGGDSGTQFYPGPGDDHVLAGTGGGVLRYDNSDQPTHGALVRLDKGVIEDDGTGGRDILKNIDNVDIYSNYGDTLYGNDHANHLSADGGDNLIVGGGGDDFLVADGGTIRGGQGDDTLASNGKVELMDGGEGADLIGLYGSTCFGTVIVKDSHDTVEDHRSPEGGEPCPPPKEKKDKDKKDKKDKKLKVKKKQEARHRPQKKTAGWQGRRWIMK
jgi:Ca2+-binding RTX toxin-like protein